MHRAEASELTWPASAGRIANASSIPRRRIVGPTDRTHRFLPCRSVVCVIIEVTENDKHCRRHDEGSVLRLMDTVPLHTVVVHVRGEQELEHAWHSLGQHTDLFAICARDRERDVPKRRKPGQGTVEAQGAWSTTHVVHRLSIGVDDFETKTATTIPM